METNSSRGRYLVSLCVNSSSVGEIGDDIVQQSMENENPVPDQNCLLVEALNHDLIFDSNLNLPEEIPTFVEYAEDSKAMLKSQDVVSSSVSNTQQELLATSTEVPILNEVNVENFESMFELENFEENNNDDPDWSERDTLGESPTILETSSNNDEFSGDERIATLQKKLQQKKQAVKHKQSDKRQQNLELRALGKEYYGLVRTKTGKYEERIRPARIIRRRCNHKATETKPSKKKSNISQNSSCRTFLCAQIDEDLRKTRFEEFWGIKTWDAKRLYVLGLVDKRKPYKRRNYDNTPRKNKAYDCYLHNKDGIKIRVCRDFLLNTLGLGRDVFHRWVKVGFETNNDEDKEESALVKTNKKKRASVQEWLKLIPKVPSHYCRSNSSRVYVESTFLSKSHMHSEYVSWCTRNSIKHIASRVTFTKVLEKEKISIHKPRKDQCDTCYQHKVGNLDQADYEEHRTKQKEARDAKAKAKSEASDRKLVITMDLQSVLLCPNLLVSKLYYSQKLQVHDFTIYSLNDGAVYLYVWHEGEGGVTSNEFVSCIADFINGQADGYEEIVLISDGCSYQNRNRILSSELSNIAIRKNIKIEQLILEKGHTMMEADSVHSTLEALFKPPICSPGDYVNRMRAARPKKPYVVNQVDHRFFKDYEGQLNNFTSIRPGKKVGDPTVTDIRALQYLPTGVVRFKVRHTDEWLDLPQRRPKSLAVAKQLYGSSRGIKAEKYAQLQDIKSVLPAEYHPFYDSLKSCS